MLGEQPAVGQGGQRVVQGLVLEQGGRPGLGPLGPPHQQGHDDASQYHQDDRPDLGVPGAVSSRDRVDLPLVEVSRDRGALGGQLVELGPHRRLVATKRLAHGIDLCASPELVLGLGAPEPLDGPRQLGLDLPRVLLGLPLLKLPLGDRLPFGGAEVPATGLDLADQQRSPLSSAARLCSRRCHRSQRCR